MQIQTVSVNASMPSKSQRNNESFNSDAGLASEAPELHVIEVSILRFGLRDNTK
jgi:hypothetical protein